MKMISPLGDMMGIDNVIILTYECFQNPISPFGRLFGKIRGVLVTATASTM